MRWGLLAYCSKRMFLRSPLLIRTMQSFSWKRLCCSAFPPRSRRLTNKPRVLKGFKGHQSNRTSTNATRLLTCGGFHTLCMITAPGYIIPISVLCLVISTTSMKMPPPLPLPRHMAPEQRERSVVLSFASSVHQRRLMRKKERAVTSHQAALGAVWGRHLFKGNRHAVEKSSTVALPGSELFTGVNFLTSRMSQSFSKVRNI